MKFITPFLMLLSFSFLNAQKLDLEKLEKLKPRNIGPAGMSGRVTTIDVNLSNTDEIFVGTASGGLWHSENDGITWTPVTEELPTQSIGAVAIQQSNPDVIWVGTGEGNPRNSQSSGAGVFRSLDGGRSWDYMGLKETKNIHRIIIHRDNPDVIYVGAQGPAWGDSEERGLYRTTDGGKTWDKILYNNDRTGIADLVVDPNNPNKMFAAMWEFRRWPWFFKSGGEGSGLYMTLDGGDNWKKLTDEDGLPKGELGRIGLAIAPSNPDIVYALVEAKENGFYKSYDGGFTWKKTEAKNIGGRPFYYADIYVDPMNENRIYNIHSVVDKSEDGGKSFQNMISYYNDNVHPDHHAWWVNPNNSNHMIDGNDGGLAITKDRGKNWRFVENIPVAQFYHINIDNHIPYRVYGGMQDNGSWIGPSRVWRAGGVRNSYWEELMFGDGFDVVPDPTDNRYGYAMWQEGNLGRYDLETGKRNYIKPIHPEDSVRLRFNWNAAISYDPYDKNTIYFGSQFVHKSTDRGENWEIISPDLTTNDEDKQQQDTSGGLTIDATGAENYTTITAISPSPIEDNVIWVGTDDGNIQVSKDDGKTWTNTTKNISGIEKGFWVPQVHPSKYEKGECYVVINDYRRDNWTPYLLHTTNYGTSWTNVLKGKEIAAFVRSFIQDPKEPNLMFLGTEFGLYITVDGGSNWTKWDKDFPSVPVLDLKIQEREDDLVVGTFGRAAWIFDDIKPFRELATEGFDILKEDLYLFETNDAYMAALRQAAGTRFSGKSMYEGSNEPFGARITFNINKPEKKKDKDTTDKEDEEYVMSTDSAKVSIYDANWKPVRNVYMKIDSNINRVYWNFARDGVRKPGQKKDEDRLQKPAGRSVIPGDYKVVVTYNENSDTTDLRVEYDPRIEYNEKDLVEVNNLYEKLEDNIRNATEAMDRVRDIQKQTDIFENLVKESEIEDKKDINKKIKAVKDSIETIYEILRGKKGNKGIVRRPNTLNQDIGTTEYYIQSAYQEPNSTHRIMVERVEKKMINLAEAVNEFLDSDWIEFKKLIEETELNLFKEIEKVKLNK